METEIVANYHNYAVGEVTDPDRVGIGLGDHAGKPRVAVSLHGAPINNELDPMWREVNWRSLTPECAQRLYELLHSIRHIWERDSDR